MRILFAGGGTLGSVTPLLALHDFWQERAPGVNSFLFVGTRHGPERALVTEAGIPFVTLPAAKLDRFFTLRLLAAPLVYLWSLLTAAALLIWTRPEVIVSAGSYVAVPLVQAGRLLGISAVLHQADLRAGLANRLVHRAARAIAVSVPEAGEFFPATKVRVTGVPVRARVLSTLERRAVLAAEAEQRFALDVTMPTLLIVGGGTGAEQINRLVSATAAELVVTANVIHVTGAGKRAATLVHRRYHHYPLLNQDELAAAYASADLIVSRAGMGAIAELAVVQTPFVLMPMPDSPQEANAEYFHNRAGAPVLGPKTSPEQFRAAIIGYLRHPTSWPGSVEKMRALLPANAAALMAEIVTSVAVRQ